MKKVLRSKKQLVADIKSAGQSFLAFKIEDMLGRTDELEDSFLKAKLVLEYHQNQHGFRDSKETGTKTRVDAAVRIIKAEGVIFALSEIMGSSRAGAVAVAKAAEALRKIQDKSLPLPLLT